MATDIVVPTAGHPPNPDGATLTTFMHDSRVLTPELFTIATSKPATVETTTLEPYGEVYHIHFEQDLTADERTLAILVAQGNAFMDGLIRSARQGIRDDKSWVSNTQAQIVNQASTIMNAPGSTTTEKQLAQGVKALANQVGDLSRQNVFLIQWILGLYSDGA